MASKQDIIREGIAQNICTCCLRGIHYYDALCLTEKPCSMAYYYADKALKDQASQDVVLEGGTADFIKCPCDDCTDRLIDEWGYFCDLACGQRSHWISRCMGASEARRAGLVATESLIEEV